MARAGECDTILPVMWRRLGWDARRRDEGVAVLGSVREDVRRRGVTFIGVCGGRDYQNRQRVREVLAGLSARIQDPRLVVVTGVARGADWLAREVAIEIGHDVVDVPALWNLYGKAAGSIRNDVIAALPLRYLVAFPGGAGTADMVRKARKAGIEVIEVRE